MRICLDDEDRASECTRGQAVQPSALTDHSAEIGYIQIATAAVEAQAHTYPLGVRTMQIPSVGNAINSSESHGHNVADRLMDLCRPLFAVDRTLSGQLV